MKFPSHQAARQTLGLFLLIIAVGLLLYDFFSPPVGELSNFSLILFAKLTAIAGALLNFNTNNNNNINPKNPLQDDESI